MDWTQCFVLGKHSTTVCMWILLSPLHFESHFFLGLYFYSENVNFPLSYIVNGHISVFLLVFCDYLLKFKVSLCCVCPFRTHYLLSAEFYKLPNCRITINLFFLIYSNLCSTRFVNNAWVCPVFLSEMQESFCTAGPPHGRFGILMKANTLKWLPRLIRNKCFIWGQEDQETIFQGQTIQFGLCCFCGPDYTKLY